MLPCRFAIFAAAIAIGVAAIPSAAGGLLSDPMSFLVWWDSVGTASAAITIVHLFAIAGFAYVAVVAALVAVADILRLELSDTPCCGRRRRALRRTLTAGAFVAVSAAAPAIADESSIIITDIGSAAPLITEIVLHDAGPVPVPPAAVPFESPDTNPATPPADSRRCRPPIAGRSSQATTSGRSRRPSSPNAAGRKPEARLPPTGARCSRRMQTVSLIRI